MTYIRLCLLFLSLLWGPMASANSLLGEPGFACMAQEIRQAGVAETQDEHIDLGLSLQRCWTNSAFFSTCPDGALGRCAMQAHSEIVATQYSIALVARTLPDDLQHTFHLLSGVNRPEKWAGCMGDHTAPSEEQADVTQTLVQQRIAFVTCDAIFTLIDSAVVMGFYMFEKAKT